MRSAVAATDSRNPPRRFAANPLTSQDLTLPHSGWRKIGDYDELDGSATVQGNAWTHCSQANVRPLQGTRIDPTPAGMDPLQQTENDIVVVNSVTDTAGSSCKLHITRSGRLFAFATRVSDDADSGGASVPFQGVADNNVGGLQMPSDVTWADFQLKNPEIARDYACVPTRVSNDLAPGAWAFVFRNVPIFVTPFCLNLFSDVEFVVTCDASVSLQRSLEVQVLPGRFSLQTTVRFNVLLQPLEQHIVQPLNCQFFLTEPLF